MAILDKVFGKNDREEALRQEIKSIELRKTSVFATIDGEITRLQGERSQVLLNAGNTAYEEWEENGASADLSGYWNKVELLEKQIAEQLAKKVDMGNRYDEEIQLISRNLSVCEESSRANRVCPKCKKIADSDADFCQICGTKL